jgi:hypothetical protein
MYKFELSREQRSLGSGSKPRREILTGKFPRSTCLYCTDSTAVCGGGVSLAKLRLPESNSGHSGGKISPETSRTYV